MPTLYCLLLGESYRQTFVCQMIDHIHDGEGSKSLLMLPSSPLLTKVRQEVLDSDPVCLTEFNLLSFDDLVVQVLEKSDIARTFMSRMTQELLVKEVVNELTSRGLLPYFCKMSHFPGCIQTITSFLGEIKRTGTTALEWQSVIAAKASEMADSVLQKDHEIALIYLMYQEKLAVLQLADLEERYLLAIGALRQNPQLLSYRYIYFSEFYMFTPLQLTIVDIIKQECELAIALVYEKNRPEIYSAVEETYSTLIGQGFAPCFLPALSQKNSCLDYLVSNIFTEQVISKRAVPCISIVQAPHRAKELAAAGAALKEQLLSRNIKPSDMAIIVRDVTEYSELRFLFAELKIPLDLVWVEPLERQPLIQLLFSYIATRLENGSKAAVQKLLQSPFVEARYLYDSDRIVTDSKSWHIQSWSGWLDFCQQDLSRENVFRQLQEQVEALPLQATAAIFNKLLLGIVAELDVLGSLALKYRQHALPLIRLKTAYLTYQALEHNCQVLESELDALGQGDRKLPLREYRQLFTQLLSMEVVQVEEGDLQGVKVMNPAGARGVSFAFVAILGLTEGEFPQQIRENWLYSDQERKLLNDLGVSLAIAARRRLEEKFYFAVSLSLAKNDLYLSGIATNETLLSPFFGEVERIVDVLPEQRTIFTADEVLPRHYEAIYTQSDYIQKTIYDMTQELVGTEAQQTGKTIFSHFSIPDFWRKIAAEKSRCEDRDGAFNGYTANWQHINGVEAAGDSVVWSVSRLEDYLKCPFAYFLNYVLRLRDEGEAEETTEASLTGQLYHQVLGTFLARYRGQRLRSENINKYESFLLADFAQIVVEWVDAGKLHLGKFWRYEQQNMTQVFINWLHYEVERQNKMTVAFQPTYFEWGFGLPVTNSMDRSSIVNPFILPVGGRQLLFCGKVDRVDVADLSYALYDYKKSGSPAVSETLELGTDLQIPLYIAAVQQLLAGPQGGTTQGGSYYSLEKCAVQGGMWHEKYLHCLGSAKITKKSFMSNEDWTEFYQNFGPRILNAVDAIAAGRFLVMPAKDCPKYCLGQGICRKSEGMS